MKYSIVNLLSHKHDTAHEKQENLIINQPIIKKGKKNTNPGPTFAFSSTVMNLPRVETAAPLSRLIYKQLKKVTSLPIIKHTNIKVV